VAGRSVYPANTNTQKGNVAEVLLAEYLVANEGTSLPIYRLRYNSNVDMSMKGDDVLAFDLDSKPMRILVGESKFRGTPRREEVEEIVDGLLRSHKAKIPVSLQFVADMLYAESKRDLARRVRRASSPSSGVRWTSITSGSSSAARRPGTASRSRRRRGIRSGSR
jgi:hypothetical protein